MPRFRFTVRRMMVAVAIAGIALCVGIWTAKCYRLYRHYLQLASSHAAELVSTRSEIISRDKYFELAWKQMQAQIDSIEARSKAPVSYKVPRDTYKDPDLPFLREKEAHHAMLAERYRRAAWMPWQPVPEEPPEPSAPDYIRPKFPLPSENPFAPDASLSPPTTARLPVASDPPEPK